jgi:hemolysin III
MYSKAEEQFNVRSHAFGLLLSIFGLLVLVVRAGKYGSLRDILSVVIFGSSLIILYAASTWYHSTEEPELRHRLRILDHASIYVLIAGTYTPFALITLDGQIGNIVFAVTWGMAICGIALKLFFTGKYNTLSTIMYVAMGWMMVFIVKPLSENLANEGIMWIAAGGFAYTTGAVLYGFKSIRFSHAIFHVFVLLGSFSHFMSVYYYVLPMPATVLR